MAKKPIPFEERKEWILDIARNKQYLNTLDKDFVDAYIDFTGAKYELTMWGANKCPLLSADLAKMYRMGDLERSATGLGSNWHVGFPRWIYVYKLIYYDLLYNSR